MDYPKSEEGVGLVDGKFVDENPATGQPGSLITAGWGNAVTEEILNVIRAASLTPAEDQVNQLVQAIKLLVPSMPTGMFAFFHTTDVPEGWLLCNGAAVSRETYANLFAKIGVKYGSGDGSTTFNLPNLDGRVLQGTTDTGEVGTYLEAQLPNIESFKQYVPAWMEYPGGGVIEWESLGAGQLVGGGSGGPFPCEMTLDASRGSAEYVTGASLQPSAIQVLACIKV